MNIYSSLEPLESRIAPAVFSVAIVSPHKATYTDVDGDLVTVAVSSGTLTAGLFTGGPGAHGGQLQMLDLSGGGFDHASLTITVKKVAGGDGLANIGYINSTGHDLGAVSVQGDLGQIDAGDSTADLGIKSLNVRSMGSLGTDDQAEGNANIGLESDIVNGLGSLTVTHDVRSAYLNVFGSSANADGTIGAVKIGGSLIGGSANQSGQIFSAGTMGAVSIGGDIRGGSGVGSGEIVSATGLGAVSVRGSLIGGYLAGGNTDSGEISSLGPIGAVTIGHDVEFGSGSRSGYIAAQNPPGKTTGTIASITIGGSLIGNSTAGGTVESDGGIGNVKIGGSVAGGLVNSDGGIGNVTVGGSVLAGTITSSGAISCAGNMGLVSIGHDLQGTSVLFSGVIFANGNIKGAHVGGSIIGGGGNISVNVTQTGGIFAGGDLGPVTVTHNLLGGKNGAAHQVTDTGFIEADGRIASVSIGGSIVSGGNFSTGTLTRSGTILAGHDLGSVTVMGSIIGAPGAGNALIAADGQLTPTATTNVAIGKITVGGEVENAQILAGFLGTTPDNADAQIGSVTVGGDWVASSIVAGAFNKGADHAPGGGDDNLNFGDANDAKITGGTDSPATASKIGSITIKGFVLGTADSVANTDHFGFVAESFGTLKIGGATVTVPAALGLVGIGETDDVAIDRIA